jgi:predicted transcriptional regulator of viral defense system
MKKETLKELDNLIYFTKDSLKSLSGDSDNTISLNINRWKKSGDIVVFKSGVYATKKSYDTNSKEEGYHKYISSILLKPSYISLSTTLSGYDILSEGVYNITAITTKLPIAYSNRKYIYRQMTDKLFLGYEVKYFRSEEYEYYEATKAKALFDYIYYRSHMLDEEINIVEELRLRLDSFTKDDFKEMSGYANIISSKKLINIINNLEKNAHTD